MNRRQFFSLLPVEQYSPEELQRIQLAYWLSKRGHDGQMRDGGERYFEHPRAVAIILMELGYTDWRTICAALLHDGKEDTFIPDLAYTACGIEVTHWVQGLSKKHPVTNVINGEIISWAKLDLDEYFTRLAALPLLGRIVKLADRLHNLRTCGLEWEPARIRRYISETETRILPIAQVTDPRFVTLLRAEIDRLEDLLNA